MTHVPNARPNPARAGGEERLERRLEKKKLPYILAQTTGLPAVSRTVTILENNEMTYEENTRHVLRTTGWVAQQKSELQ